MAQDSRAKNMLAKREHRDLRPVTDNAAHDAGGAELGAAMVELFESGASIEEIMDLTIGVLNDAPEAQKEVVAIRDRWRADEHDAREQMKANGAPKLARAPGSRTLSPASPLADRLAAFGTRDKDFAVYMEQRIHMIVGDDVISANGLLAVIKGMGVRNEGEALLAGQYAAMTHTALELLAAANGASTNESRTAYLKMAVRLGDASQNALGALRKESQQAPALNVGSVNVADGGQAIVGQVNASAKRANAVD